MLPMNATAVAVLARDLVTQEGASARLAAHPEVTVLAPDQCSRAGVLLLITTAVAEDDLQLMERAYHQSPGRGLRVVVVAYSMNEQHILRAVRSGLVGLLYRQDSGYDQIIEAILDADASRAQLPQATLRHLIDQVRTARNGALAAAEVPAAGLASREVEVLRLISDGLDTTEVAAKLNYSERTVKNIVHAVVVRQKLRNRTHAVAYALRAGAL
jgi:DNA-binding NarL/FixJ family response regulator